MSIAPDQFKQPKVSAMVADLLRQRVLDGELTDMLPGQDVLLAELNISKPSLREALRILESEGLITVRRGNLGGAYIHRPTARHAAYMMAVVLQSKAAVIEDVATALRQLEGVCAGLCAARSDRAVDVVPALQQSNERAHGALDDPLNYVDETADFHRLIVSLCGNKSMQLTVGALEAIWLAHVQEWAETQAREGTFPDREYRAQGLAVHRALTSLIADGNVLEASRLAEEHFDPRRFYSVTAAEAQPVRADLLHTPTTHSTGRRRA